MERTSPIRLAKKQAEKSVFKRARVGAVIVKGKRLLSSGWNYIGYSKYLPNRPYPESIHAEQEAILGLLRERRQGEMVGADIYVCRVNCAGNAKLARPCPVCTNLIKSVGIRRVFYTNEYGSTSHYSNI